MYALAMENGELLQGGEEDLSEAKQKQKEASDVTEDAHKEHELESAHGPVDTAEVSAEKTNSDTLAFSLASLDMESSNFEQELQHQLVLKEEEVTRVFEAKFAELEARNAAQLEAIEANRQQQAAEFTAEIERLKQQHVEEVKNALNTSTHAQEQLQAVKEKHAEEVELIRAEREKEHAKEIQSLRAELEQLHTKMKVEGESDKWQSLLPQSNPQHSPQMQKEIRLLKERLQRQHQCELKAQDQKLRSELSLERDALQAKLEEEYTGKLAKALTESALKNATQVEEISQQLRLEKQRAVSLLEKEQETRREQEVTRSAEERREALEACRMEFELARKEYQSKIAELEMALARESEGKVAVLSQQHQEDWAEREDRLRGDMELECRQQVKEARTECEREKEEALVNLREALEERLQVELRAAHEMHQQAMRENQAQLQANYEKELATVHMNAQPVSSEPRQDGQYMDARIETIRAEMVKEHKAKFQEMTEKLQALHQAEVAGLQREREAENGRHQEEVERVREEMEARLHRELEQVSEDGKGGGCLCTCTCTWKPTLHVAIFRVVGAVY